MRGGKMDWDIKQTADQHIVNTYARYPLALVKGQGCTLWDDQGKAYTDFLAGIAVCNLGHCHPQLAAVLIDQAENLWHVSNLYYTASRRTGNDRLCGPALPDDATPCPVPCTDQ